MSNSIDALKPEFWSASMQIPLFKSLVAMEVATTRLESDLKQGDTVNMPYSSDLSAQSYSAGTDYSTIDFTVNNEYLTADQMYVVPFYVDNTTLLQTPYRIVGYNSRESAYRLRDTVDSDVLGEYTNADDQMDDGDLGGTDGSGISATTSNIIQIFTTSRKKLRDNNVTENGDFFAVISTSTAEILERKLTGVGFNVADSALRNGFAGNFMGFDVYVSNNLTNATYGGESCDHHVFGKKGAIDVVIQSMPGMRIVEDPDRLGRNFAASLVYGLKTFTKNSKRFFDVPIRTA